MRRAALAVVLALAARAALAAAPVPAQPVAFVGFAADPLKRMELEGVRVVVTQGVDANGRTTIEVRVYERDGDAYGNTFWKERVALCPASAAEPEEREDEPADVPVLVSFDHLGEFPPDPPQSDH